jgi:hypothetical protein
MPARNYSEEDLFSPLDGDVGVVRRFSVGHADLEAQPHVINMYITPQSTFQKTRRGTILCKPVIECQQVPMSHDSYISSSSDADFAAKMEKVAKAEADAEVAREKQKRGWQFYCTFGCLAILNLICAIDATILSVALPVWNPTYMTTLLLNFPRQSLQT